MATQIGTGTPHEGEAETQRQDPLFYVAQDDEHADYELGNFRQASRLYEGLSVGIKISQDCFLSVYTLPGPKETDQTSMISRSGLVPGWLHAELGNNTFLCPVSRASTIAPLYAFQLAALSVREARAYLESEQHDSSSGEVDEDSSGEWDSSVEETDSGVETSPVEETSSSDWDSTSDGDSTSDWDSDSSQERDRGQETLVKGTLTVDKHVFFGYEWDKMCASVDSCFAEYLKDYIGLHVPSKHRIKARYHDVHPFALGVLFTRRTWVTESARIQVSIDWINPSRHCTNPCGRLHLFAKAEEDTVYLVSAGGLGSVCVESFLSCMETLPEPMTRSQAVAWLESNEIEDLVSDEERD